MQQASNKTDGSRLEPSNRLPVIAHSPLWGLLAGALSALLWVLSIPPFEFAEAAYIAFIPLILWLYTRPSRRLCLAVALGTAWIAWFAILIWLRHVTLFGTIALAGMLATIFMLWMLLVHSVLPLVATRSFAWRALAFASLAGAWVVLEWSRTWLLWGFPWAPLSLSQWQRPVVLQIAAWTGAYGVSFLLIYFNFCIAQTLRNRLVAATRTLWSGWLSLDLYLALALLGLCVWVFFKSLPTRDSAVTLCTAAVVQPYIKPDVKWDDAKELENLHILEQQTRRMASLESDLVLWPEAATPWPVKGYPQMQARVEALVDEIAKPILMGNMAVDRAADQWYNGAFLVEPTTGLAADFYVKRELVPFGEFVPKSFEFIDKVVPVGGNFVPGTEPGLMDLNINHRSLRIGSLVCYEDIFPSLARNSARAGAQIFFVTTNNAWYGEEGGAPQHAAHSVLRAVENRRPVMRCGNGGWSGWIDAYGTVREVLRRSSLFSMDDIKDITSLATKLKFATDSVSIYLRSQFDTGIQNILNAHNDSEMPSKECQNAIIERLNNVIKQDTCIYDKTRFDGIVLSAETEKLLAQNPEGEDLIHLNRLLLEDAYSLEIKENLLRDADGSIYSEGVGCYTVVHFKPWLHRHSIYTRYGDWFVAVCGVLSLVGISIGRPLKLNP